jgi:membrane-associated protease RseP (regulator of RpoE activity)
MRLIAALVYLIGVYAVLLALPNFYLPGNLGARLAAVWLAVFVATLAHEIGHAWAVRALGGQVRVFMVAPFKLQLKPRRLTLAIPIGNGDLGGYVSYTLDRVEARRGHALIAAAGPAANIVLALLAALAAVLIAGPQGIAAVATGYSGGHPPSHAEFQAWMTRRDHIALAEFLAVVSAGMALANLIPFKGSDGGRIYGALTHRSRGKRG